jgi:hypothetical protein
MFDGKARAFQQLVRCLGLKARLYHDAEMRQLSNDFCRSDFAHVFVDWVTHSGKSGDCSSYKNGSARHEPSLSMGGELNAILDREDW